MGRSKKPPSPPSEKRIPPSKPARRWALPAAVAIAAALLPLLALLRGDAAPLLLDSPVRLQDALRQGLHDELIPRHPHTQL